MRKIIAKLVSFAVLFFMPLFALADFSRQYDQLYNPLPSNQLICYTAVCDLTQFAVLIIRDFLQLIPVTAVLFIIIGGFQMMTAGGNEERLIRAKKTILWAVLGLVAALMSFAIIAIVKNLLGANTP